jgi:uncharacterized protein YdhG (YjbR/CyaY superfamily)
MKGSAAKDVDSYLAKLPPDVRATLEKLRQTIKAAAPEAEEVISYHMPCYKYQGVLVYFGAFAEHCSFFPAGKSMLVKFAKELAPFEAEGGTIRFTVDHPLPKSLVTKIVKARMKENVARKRK